MLPGAALPGRMAVPCGVFSGTATLFPLWLHHQQGARLPISPHPRQHWWFYVSSSVNVLMGVSWCLVVASICVSLMISDVEWFSVLFLGCSYVFFEKWPFQSWAHF